MKREKHMTSYGGMRNLASELDYRDGWNNNHFEKGKAEVLNAYKERISVGQPMDGISELGGLDRQLLQSSEFFPAGNAILRKVTPEEETANALVDVGWIPNPIRETLLLMDLEDINKGPLLSVLRTIHRELFSSDERKKERGARALSWLVDPERHYLWDESNELDALLKAEGGLDTVNDTGQGEDEDCLAAEAEEFLNLGNLINPEFTEECRAVAQTIKPRKEFRPPRDRYQFADRYRYNPNSEAKERRLYDLKGNLRAIQDLRSIEAIEKYLDLLREDYAEDVILWREWSLVRKEQDRKLYLQFLRAQELDEETIRAKLWACFDREAEKIAEGWQEKTPVKVGWFEHFNPQTNKVEEGEEGEKFEMTLEEVAELEKKLGRNPQVVETKFRYVKPCIWEIERSRAFRELHHTKGDWNKIYSKVWTAMEEALIGRARVANTADGRRFVRRKLGQWSFRLSNEAKIEIASILSEKEAEQRRNSNQGA
jgi:hypothetical protein